MRLRIENMIDLLPRVCLVCLLIFLGFPQESYAVRQENLILSTAVVGQILDHGKPVAGVRVQRIISWNMGIGAHAEFTTTNVDGQFQFPEVRGAAEFGYLARLFHVPTILIDVNLLEVDASTSLFAVGRTSYKPAVETGYDIIQLKCDLKDRQMYRERLPIIDCKVEQSNHLGLLE